jgi:hypothetical protein
MLQPDAITHWPAAPGGNVYGEGWGAPAVHPARVVPGTYEVAGAEGGRVLAQAKVYHRVPTMRAGDWVAVGDHVAQPTPQTDPEALRVVATKAVPNTDSTGVLYVAYIGKG